MGWGLVALMAALGGVDRFAGDVPFVGALTLLVSLGVALRFGLVGNSVAWKQKGSRSSEAFTRAERRWAIAGVTVWAVAIPLYGLWAFR